MNTFGTIIAAKEREGEARGLELGEARGLELGEARGLELGEARGLELGKKKILVQFVAEFWDDDEAARFARQLDHADHSQFPTIANLVQDQAAGRLPCLRQSGRANSGK